MGTFAGHAVPGSFFIIFSLWWTVATYYQYTKAKKTKSRYRSTLFFTCNNFPHIPIESSIKVLCCTVGVIGEAVTGFDSKGNFVNLGNGQHITMFSFFGLQAIVEILIFYNVNLPPNIEYVSNVLAFLMEGVLFFYHLHGRTPLDIHVHILLIFVIFAGCIAVILEGAYRNNVLFPLFRAYCVMLQGTWFYQVGFILYPPLPGMEHWEDHNHGQMMIVTMMFTWHCAVDFVLILCIGLMVTKHIHQISKSSFSMHSMLPINKTMNEKAPLTQSDSESEEI